MNRSTTSHRPQRVWPGLGVWGREPVEPRDSGPVPPRARLSRKIGVWEGAGAPDPTDPTNPCPRGTVRSNTQTKQHALSKEKNNDPEK